MSNSMMSLGPPSSGSGVDDEVVDDVSSDVRDAARQASTDAFSLAMYVSAGLLLIGAAINGVGIRNPSPESRVEPEAATGPPPADPGVGLSSPRT